MLKLKDVADVEFGTLEYDMASKSNGKPSASIMIKQRPGSNAQEVIKNIKTKVAELKKTTFPPGMDYFVSYDVSRFLDASIHEVVRTLIEAFILVIIIVYLFLARFPFDAYSSAGRAGCIGRYICIYAVVWLFYQSSDFVCIGTGHRYCRR
jgi:HAE1 family hydrophobic/amphiphilic exporter-1